MGQPTSKPDFRYAYTPPTRSTAYGPDTGSMDWSGMSTAKREARLNSAFKALGETSNDTVGDIRGNESVKSITNDTYPDRPGQTEEPMEGRGT